MAKGGEGGYRQINKNFNACAFDDYLSSQTSHLPSLPNTERISPRVIRVLGGNPGKVRDDYPLYHRLLNQHLLVHITRDEYLHCRYRLTKIARRHRSRL